jgi:uncharacterized membrane protein YdbT with pleckstrin-like domain
VSSVRPAIEQEQSRMPNPLIRRLWLAGRAVVLCLVLLALLLQTYGLYIAAALVPHQPWRRRLDYHLRRAMFAMDNMHLTAQK